MTQDFENMLYLFGANANSAQVKINGELNAEAIRKYAVEQGIWTMVYPELSKICNASKYKEEFWKTISTGITRKEFTLNIIKKLEADGIKCCLLKGAAVAETYAEPECRISSDTDILIDPKDETRLAEILIKNGYIVEKRKKNDHHLRAYHKTGGLLEAHIRLYSYMTANILFNGLEMYTEQWDTVNISGFDFNVLGINDGLIYLTAHYIKHLINSGGGVRQMMDLLLYIEKYKNKIDFEKYDNILRKLKYDKLVEVIKAIGGKYFGFDYEVNNLQLMNRILDDTQNGGIFGFSTDRRKNFYENYCKRRTEMSKMEYFLMNVRKSENSLLFKLFPDKNTLIQCGYKYAGKTYLVPIAWIHRLASLLKKRILGKRVKPANDARMRLMKDLGMI